MAISSRLSSPSLSAAPAALPVGHIPLAARDRMALQQLFGPLTPVPGHAYAFLVRTPAGRQLFIDSTQLPRSRWSTVDFGVLWRAAFGKPLPNGYRAMPYDGTGGGTAPPPSQGEPVGLVVIAIIAILISLMVPAIQKTQEPGKPVISVPPSGLKGVLLN